MQEKNTREKWLTGENHNLLIEESPFELKKCGVSIRLNKDIIIIKQKGNVLEKAIKQIIYQSYVKW